MNCRNVQKQIRARKHPEPLSDVARAHIANCAECARTVAVARVEKTLFRAVARTEATEPWRGFEERVLRRIEAEPPQSEAALVYGKLAWRLIPALTVLTLALAAASFWSPERTATFSDLNALDQWATEWVQLDAPQLGINQ